MGDDSAQRRRFRDLFCTEHAAEVALQQGIPEQRRIVGKFGPDGQVCNYFVCDYRDLSEGVPDL